MVLLIVTRQRPVTLRYRTVNWYLLYLTMNQSCKHRYCGSSSLILLRLRALFLPKQTTAATTRPLPSERRWLGSGGTKICLERQHVVCQWDYYLLYLPLSLQHQRETAEPSVTKGKENQSLIHCCCCCRCWIFPLSRVTEFFLWPFNSKVNNSSYLRIPHNSITHSLLLRLDRISIYCPQVVI